MAGEGAWLALTAGILIYILDWRIQYADLAEALGHVSFGWVALALGWGVVVQVVRCLGIYVLFLVLGHGELLIECIALVPVIAFVGMFPPAMSHLAVNAGTTVALFGQYGVPEADALVVSVVNSGAILLLIPIGAVCYWLGPRVRPESGEALVSQAA